jgi:hypothetical protein
MSFFYLQFLNQNESDMKFVTRLKDVNYIAHCSLRDDYNIYIEFECRIDLKQFLKRYDINTRVCNVVKIKKINRINVLNHMRDCALFDEDGTQATNKYRQRITPEVDSKVCSGCMNERLLDKFEYFKNGKVRSTCIFCKRSGGTWLRHKNIP